MSDYYQVIIKRGRSSSPCEVRTRKEVIKLVKQITRLNDLSEINITVRPDWELLEKEEYLRLKEKYEVKLSSAQSKDGK